MKLFIQIAVAVTGFGLVWWLRNFPFREKKPVGPERTENAELIGRDIRPGANRSGRSKGGFNFVLVFRLEDGSEVELYAHEVEYGALREGMKGWLTWHDRYYVNLETASVS